MTPEQMKAHAERIIRNAVEGIEFYTVAESLDFDAAAEDTEKVSDLVFGATVTITFPGAEEAVTLELPEPVGPPTDDEIRRAANDAYHSMVDEAGEWWMGFDHQRDAFEQGWFDGFKAAEHG